jgi:uncharacterized protein with HEPN domain
MPSRSVRARLDDIREALAGIETTLVGVSFETFATSWQLQRAIERGLEIISAASRSLPDELKQRAPQIQWPAIAVIGNILRHEYQRVETRLVWNIAEQHLGPLRAAIDAISTALDQSSG